MTRSPAEAQELAARVLPRLELPQLPTLIAAGPSGVPVPGDKTQRWFPEDMRLPPECRRRYQLADDGVWRTHPDNPRAVCFMGGEPRIDADGRPWLWWSGDVRPTAEQVEAWCMGTAKPPRHPDLDPNSFVPHPQEWPDSALRRERQWRASLPKPHQDCQRAFFEAVMARAQQQTRGSSDDWAIFLERVEVGVRTGGRWELCLIENHVLVVGMTGSGKGSVFWSIIHGLAPAVLERVARLWALDPKRLELGLGRGCFYRYANQPGAMVELLEEAEAAAQDRMDRLTGGARKFVPSQEYPVEVILIDELGYLVSMADRKLRERFDTALNNLLFMGRAVGFVLVGAIVDPRKSWLDSRGNWPTRVALKLSEKPLVDMTLRDGAYEQGAHCDAIPRGQAGAGSGYVISEDLAAPEMVRAFWVDDRAVKKIEDQLARVVRAASSAPAGQFGESSKRTAAKQRWLPMPEEDEAS